MRPHPVFPRRAFQRQLLRRLRAVGQPEALTPEVIAQLVSEAGGEATPAAAGDAATVRATVAELIDQRMVSGAADWDVGGTVALGPQPILGETAEERFARLPPLPELPPWMIVSGRLLTGLAAVLFVTFYFTYLPQSKLAQIMGAAALIGALLSHAGLRLSDQRALTGLRWTMLRWVTMAAICGALAALLGVGVANPCVIKAPPGSQIWVDGKLFEEIAPNPSSDRLLCTTPVAARLHLHWDDHEISVRKNWHVDPDWHTEWTHPVRVHWMRWGGGMFAHWKGDSVLVPSVRIAANWMEPANAIAPDGSPAKIDLRWRKLASGWNDELQDALSGGGLVKSDAAFAPFVVRVELRSRADGSAEIIYALFNAKGEILRPLRPVPVADPNVPASLDAAKKEVFSQLEAELRVGRLLGSPETVAAAQLQNNAQALPHEPEIGLLAESTAAALPQLMARPRPRSSAQVTPTKMEAALWNGAAVGLEALRLGKPQEAATVATAISDVGRQAIAAGDLQTAAAANSSLAQIAAVSAPPVGSGPPPRATPPPEGLEVIAAAHATMAAAVEQQRQQPAPAPPKRVFFQISGEAQRAETLPALTALQAAHYLVPGVQNVLGRAYVPDTTEVRYFDPAPSVRAEAAAILAILRQRGAGVSARVSYVIASPAERKDPTWLVTHFEVWFAKDWTR